MLVDFGRTGNSEVIPVKVRLWEITVDLTLSRLHVLSIRNSSDQPKNIPFERFINYAGTLRSKKWMQFMLD